MFHRQTGRSRLGPALLAAIALLSPTLQVATAWALPGDRDQPIRITADKALRDEKERVTTYTGNVTLVQGSMELEADQLTIYHTTEQADKIVATGNPAKMRQRPEPDKAIVHAQGKVITYYRSEDKVNLLTNARIEQDGAVVSGNSIDYFIAKELIEAQSDKSGRVEVVIPPNMQEKLNEDGSGATESE